MDHLCLRCLCVSPPALRSGLSQVAVVQLQPSHLIVVVDRCGEAGRLERGSTRHVERAVVQCANSHGVNVGDQRRLLPSGDE